MKGIFILAFFVAFFGTNIQAQTFEELEKDLVALHQKIAAATTDDARMKASNDFREELRFTLNKPGAFEYEFQNLNKMSVLTSSDKLLRIFNWNVSREDQTHRYYCLILKKKSKKVDPVLYELNDDEKSADKIEQKYLKPENWLGALYYAIIPIDKKGKTYTVLGWDGNNKLTNKKVIDALSFNGEKIKIGAPIFKSEIGTQKRVIFEYAKDISMSLKFYPKSNEIIFDHLSPRNPAMTGNYAFYGPDLSFDAYQLTKGKWVLVEDVEITLDRDASKRPYSDPRR